MWGFVKEKEREREGMFGCEGKCRVFYLSSGEFCGKYSGRIIGLGGLEVRERERERECYQ